MKIIALSICTIIAVASSAHAQEPATVVSPNAPLAERSEPVDASFIPQVESKTEALELVSVVRRDQFIRIKLKNVSGKNIYAFRMSYHKSGASTLVCFIMADDKTSLSPGEVYKYDYPFIPTSSLAREPLTFEAVLFEDGTGDGNSKKVKSLQDVFLASRKELEHVTAVVQEAAESPGLESQDSLRKLVSTLSETPNYLYGVALQELAGMAVPAWKETAMLLIQDLEKKRMEVPGINVGEELVKIKDGFVKTLGKYPSTN